MKTRVFRIGMETHPHGRNTLKPVRASLTQQVVQRPQVADEKTKIFIRFPELPAILERKFGLFVVHVTSPQAEITLPDPTRKLNMLQPVSSSDDLRDGGLVIRLQVRSYEFGASEAKLNGIINTFRELASRQ